jgi:phospholipid/cholesterol/gamma-HCH transport system substrate-binding protein
MQDSRINYVIVGSFVAAVLAIFILVVSMLAGRSGATDEYFTVYDNVGGLKFGTQVLYEGYQIGQVESIEPMFKGQNISFRVNFSVQEGWKIPDDSIARASVSGLLSAMTIDIDGGTSPNALKPGSQVKGASASNMFAALSQIGAQFGELSAGSIKPLLDTLTNYVKSLDKMTAENVPVLLGNLNKISQDMSRDVPEITGSIRRSTVAIEKGPLSAESLERIDTIISNLDKTTANLSAFTGDLNEVRRMLVKSMESVNKLVEDNAGNIDESARSLRYTLDTISRYVDDIAQNTEVTTRNLAEFSRAIRENPGLLVSGSPQSDQSKSKSK